MNTLTGLLIPVDQPPRLVTFNGDTLADYHKLLDGGLEEVPSPAGMSLLVNDLGKLQGKPVNWQAHRLLDPFGLGDMLHGDVLCGPVLVMGPVCDGDYTDVSEHVACLVHQPTA